MNEDLAKRRFMILSLIRLSSVIMAFVGAANIAGKLLPSVSPYFGYILIALAAFDFFFVTRMLIRRWRTPPEL